MTSPRHKVRSLHSDPMGGNSRIAHCHVSRHDKLAADHMFQVSREKAFLLHGKDEPEQIRPDRFRKCEMMREDIRHVSRLDELAFQGCFLPSNPSPLFYYFASSVNSDANLLGSVENRRIG